MGNYNISDRRKLRELERRQRQAKRQVVYHCQACGSTEYLSYTASPITGQIFLLCAIHRIELKLNSVISITDKIIAKYEKYIKPYSEAYMSLADPEEKAQVKQMMKKISGIISVPFPTQTHQKFG